MSEVVRAKAPKLVLEGGEWRNLSEQEAINVIRALDNKVRRDVFHRLSRPMRKFELAEHIHRALGKKYSRSLVQHHLELLRRAGLIEYKSVPGSLRGKLVCRVADVRVQLRPRVTPPTELAKRLKRVYEK
jgi:DNA-binding transcriptional ArsR family regulator